MSETQISRTHPELTARSAMWLTCPDCSHASRVLVVMASRVLNDRRECPACLSTRAPHLRLTQPGAHVPASEATGAEWNKEEEAYLRAWVEADARISPLRRWHRVLLSRLAARFSRTKPIAVQTRAADAADESGLNLSPTENDLS